MKTYSLLQKYKKKNFFTDPFPHLIIENALPDNLYNDLSQKVPNNFIENIDTNNLRGNVFLNQINDNPEHELWTNFLKYHQSEEFFNEVFNIFRNDIEKIHVGISKKVEKIKKISIFENENSSNKDTLNLNSYYCYNTPVKNTSSVRGIHLDFYNKLHIGLFYLRSKNDNTVGGNLALHKWRENYNLTKKKQILFTEKFKQLDLHTSKIKEIPYQKNTFFLAINSIDALHSVTMREKTNQVRQFCYFYSSLNYDLENFKANLFEKLSIKDITLLQKFKILILSFKNSLQKILFKKK